MAMPIPAMPEPSNPRYHLLAMLRAVGLTERELREILNDGAEEAERTIPKLMERAGIGARATGAQISLVLREIRAMQAALWGDMGPEFAAGVARAAEYAAGGEDVLFGYASRELGTRAANTLRDSFIARAKQGIDAILAKAKNGIPLSLQVYRTQALATGLVTRRVNAGLLLGYSAKKIAGMVRDLIRPDVAGGVSYAAFRLARTEINHAYQTAQEARYADEPWSTGMQWHLSGSHPKPDECDVFATQDEHGLGAGVYPFGQVPTEHPNGLCYRTAVQVSEDDFIEGFLAGEYDEYLDTELGVDADELKPAANPTTAPRPPIVSGTDRMSWASGEAFRGNAFDNPKAEEDVPLLNFGPLGDPVDRSLAYIGGQQGYDGLPVTVNKREADLELTRGGTEIWRGTTPWKGNKDVPARSAADIDDAFRNGAYEPGTGIYGNGYYFSVSERVGQHYASKQGVVTRAVLRAGARVITSTELEAVIKRIFNDDSLDIVLRHSVAADPGRCAALLGYDAIKVVGHQDGTPYVKGEPSAKNGQGHRFSAHVQYVILNRTALLVEEADR